MNKEQIKNYFWTSLRKNLMWRDSESGLIEKHIDELLDNVIKINNNNLEEEKLKIKLRLKEKYDMTELELSEIIF